MGSTNTTCDHTFQTVRRLGMSSMISCDSTRVNNVETQTKYFQEFIFNDVIPSITFPAGISAMRSVKYIWRWLTWKDCLESISVPGIAALESGLKIPIKLQRMACRRLLTTIVESRYQGSCVWVDGSIICRSVMLFHNKETFACDHVGTKVWEWYIVHCVDCYQS